MEGGQVPDALIAEHGFSVLVTVAKDGREQAWLGGEWRPDPLVLDDQALIINVKGKGLLVLTGCGHAGVVNIARYARRLTGGQPLYALLGMPFSADSTSTAPCSSR